jgi:hypothetical protein
MKKTLLTAGRRALFLQLFLALSLILAQNLAQAHTYSHSAPSGQPCSECLSSTPLLSAAGSPDSPRIVFASSPCVVIPFTTAVLLESSRYFGFRSRAPPTLP